MLISTPVLSNKTAMRYKHSEIRKVGVRLLKKVKVQTCFVDTQ